jgi:hypothetical protein
VTWQNGQISDLNQPGAVDTLIFANDINDSGAITGQAFDPRSNSFVAFTARP